MKHYRAVCEAAQIPVIAYNVPSRTGMGIDVATCRELAKLPNLAGIKEASGELSKATRMLEFMPVWSGNDDQMVAMMALGGSGVISVASNVVPEAMNAMVRSALMGNYPLAAALQSRLLPLMDLLFCEVNPIPVKAAMAAMGYCEDYLRLPLTPMEEAHKAVLLSLMREQGLI